MGEGFRRKRKEDFRHQQDKAFFDELRRRHIFSDRPEVFITHYPCRLGGSSEPITEQDRLYIRKPTSLQETDAYLEVLCSNKLIGKIEGEPAKELVSIMDSDERCGGIVAATMVSRSVLDSGITLRCVDSGVESGKERRDD